MPPQAAARLARANAVLSRKHCMMVTTAKEPRNRKTTPGSLGVNEVNGVNEDANEVNEVNEDANEVNEDANEVNEDANEVNEVNEDANEVNGDDNEVNGDANEVNEDANEVNEDANEVNEVNGVNGVNEAANEVNEDANEVNGDANEVNEVNEVNEDANEVNGDANEVNEVNEDANEVNEDANEVNKVNGVNEDANGVNEVNEDANEVNGDANEVNEDANEVNEVNEDANEVNGDANEVNEVNEDANEVNEVNEDANEVSEVREVNGRRPLGSTFSSSTSSAALTSSGTRLLRNQLVHRMPLFRPMILMVSFRRASFSYTTLFRMMATENIHAKVREPAPDVAHVLKRVGAGTRVPVPEEEEDIRLSPVCPLKKPPPPLSVSGSSVASGSTSGNTMPAQNRRDATGPHRVGKDSLCVDTDLHEAGDAHDGLVGLVEHLLPGEAAGGRGLLLGQEVGDVIRGPAGVDQLGLEESGGGVVLQQSLEDGSGSHVRVT
ncbi:Replicase polyprotein 1a [Liparis tanakae]|uniref:Replicase polyprotein 1a n=1 Tax=Liparis tanakae TaxID=230148 RepID=A0A4Z2EW44_9TELE|nr:Replicase polyprotein 1a [Liparis tanakae]